MDHQEETLIVNGVEEKILRVVPIIQKNAQQFMNNWLLKTRKSHKKSGVIY